MKRGTQIVYVPDHAADENDPDCEYGFITSIHKDGIRAFCRYWSKHNTGLRTTANSELTEIRNLVERDTHAQAEVDSLLEAIDGKPVYESFDQ